MKRPHVLTLTAAVLAIVFTAGCATQSSNPPMPEVPDLSGENVVLILQHDSYFNYTLKNKISDWLVERGYKVVSDGEYLADKYAASHYGAVVFLAKLEARGSMRIMDNFIDRYGDANVVVSISHEWTVDGDSIEKPYDAFTAASKEFEQEEIFDKITGRLSAILNIQ